MNAISRIKTVVLLLTILATQGCSTAPQLQASIDQCSREANAYTASSRIGNGAYWSCLDRVEKAQARQEKMLEQRAYLISLQSRCDAFGFKRNTNEFSNCMMLQKQQDDLNTIQRGQLREQAAERQRKERRDFQNSLKPQWIADQCPQMLNARPGQYGPGC